MATHPRCFHEEAIVCVRVCACACMSLTPLPADCCLHNACVLCCVVCHCRVERLRKEKKAARRKAVRLLALTMCVCVCFVHVRVCCVPSMCVFFSISPFLSARTTSTVFSIPNPFLTRHPSPVTRHPSPLTPGVSTRPAQGAQAAARAGRHGVGSSSSGGHVIAA